MPAVLAEDLLELDSRHTVVVRDQVISPYVVLGDALVPAVPGDGVVAALLRTLREGPRWCSGHLRVTPGSAEAPPPLSNTPESAEPGVWRHGETTVTWHTGLLTAAPDAGLLRRLDAAGFPGMAPLRGLIEWQSYAEQWVVAATVTETLPGTEDASAWAMRAARGDLGLTPGEPSPFAGALGELIARLHLALADGDGAGIPLRGPLRPTQVRRTPAGRLVLDGLVSGKPQPADRHLGGLLDSVDQFAEQVRRHVPIVPQFATTAWAHRIREEVLAGYRPLAGHLLERPAGE